jgi:hypothetical protein
MITKCDQPIEKREKLVNRLADSQRSSTLPTDWWVNQSADGQLKDRPMERKKAVIKEIRQKESMEEVDQSTIDNGSKS